MSDCDEGERKGDNAYCGYNLPKKLYGGGPQMSKEEYDEIKKQPKVKLPPVGWTKDTNPKDAVGVRKAPISTLSMGVMFEAGLAMLEGARKYGRHNYRVAGVRASIYMDALFRHMAAWWCFSQDTDPASGLHHVTKAIAGLTVLRDAMLMDNWVDDRPPPLPIELLEEFNRLAGEIIDRIPDAKEPFTREHSSENHTG